MNLRTRTIIVLTYLMQTQATQSAAESVRRKRAHSQSDQRPSKKQFKRK